MVVCFNLARLTIIPPFDENLYTSYQWISISLQKKFSSKDVDLEKKQSEVAIKKNLQFSFKCPFPNF